MRWSQAYQAHTIVPAFGLPAQNIHNLAEGIRRMRIINKDLNPSVLNMFQAARNAGQVL